MAWAATAEGISSYPSPHSCRDILPAQPGSWPRFASCTGEETEAREGEWLVEGHMAEAMATGEPGSLVFVPRPRTPQLPTQPPCTGLGGGGSPQHTPSGFPGPRRPCPGSGLPQLPGVYSQAGKPEPALEETTLLPVAHLW